MILLTRQLHTALRANAISRRACEARGERFDPVPLAKLFNPIGAATWLAIELAEDCNTLFGLADLGFGPGEESLEVRLFDEAEIPWETLAFRTIVRTLRTFFLDRKLGSFPVRVSAIAKRPPISPDLRGAA